MTYIAVDLALVPRHDSRDVVLDGLGQRGLVLDVADPAGELRVPDKGVPADGLVVLGGPVDQVIGLTPAVGALLVVDALPFHAVLGRDLAEVGIDDGRVLARRETALIRAGAVVQLALGLDQLVDAGGRLPGLNSRGRQRGERRQEEREGGLHLDDDDSKDWEQNCDGSVSDSVCALTRYRSPGNGGNTHRQIYTR